MQTTLILVPTYNEADNIEPLFTELTRQVPHADILVIDDNSSDGTAEKISAAAARNARIHLLSRGQKLGLASAYLDGMAWGIERAYDVIVQMDADFSHRPQDLNVLLAALSGADAAFGCRYMAGGSTPGWSWVRRAISRGGNLYARVTLRLSYRDLTGGFNAWKREVLSAVLALPPQSKGYAFQIELKCRAHDLGFRLREVPICFQERRAGQSKINSNILVEAILRVPFLRRASSAVTESRARKVSTGGR